MQCYLRRTVCGADNIACMLLIYIKKVFLYFDADTTCV